MKSLCKHYRFFLSLRQIQTFGKTVTIAFIFHHLMTKMGWGSRPISHILQIHRLTSILSILSELEKLSLCDIIKDTDNSQVRDHTPDRLLYLSPS